MVWTGVSVAPNEPDPEIAAMYLKAGAKPARSRITSTDWLLTAINRKALGLSMRRRFVDLSCGHKAITASARHMDCPRCAEMMRQGMDFEAWINRREHAYDGMIWREDPCRHFNEHTDLAGEFVNDPEAIPAGRAALARQGTET